MTAIIRESATTFRYGLITNIWKGEGEKPECLEISHIPETGRFFAYYTPEGDFDVRGAAESRNAQQAYQQAYHNYRRWRYNWNNML